MGSSMLTPTSRRDPACSCAPGFAQWKDIMQLLLSCEEAPLRTRTPLYVRFLAALRAQLWHSFGQVR